RRRLSPACRGSTRRNRREEASLPRLSGEYPAKPEGGGVSPLLVGGVPGKAGGGGPRGGRGGDAARPGGGGAAGGGGGAAAAGGGRRQGGGRGAPGKSGEYPAQPGEGGGQTRDTAVSEAPQRLAVASSSSCANLRCAAPFRVGMCSRGSQPSGFW